MCLTTTGLVVPFNAGLETTLLNFSGTSRFLIVLRRLGRLHGFYPRSAGHGSKWDGIRRYAIPALPWTGKSHTVTSFPRSIIPVS